MAFAAATEPISVKLRKDERESFTAVCDEIGDSPSNAIRMFDSAFSYLGGFPFDPSNPCRLSPETLAVVDDSAAGGDLSGPYRTVKEAMVAFDED